MHRKFFPPATEGEGVEAGAKNEGEGVEEAGEEEGRAKVPDLPDVPKDEPKVPGQPEHKKAKLDE